MSFAETMNLRPGDVVIAPKSEFQMVGHYVVYGEMSYGTHFYYENIVGFGVRRISEEQFVSENPKYSRIRRLNGDNNERDLAMQRAKSLLGRSYNVATFNCETYANYVQYGTGYSQQVKNVAAGVAIAAVIVGLIAVFGGNKNKNKKG